MYDLIYPRSDGRVRPLGAWLARCVSAAVVLCVATQTQAADKVTYEQHIRPVFQNNCFTCHNADTARAGINLTSYRTTMAGGGGGSVLEAGSADNSWLYLLITHAAEPAMPPGGTKLADADIALVQQWIEGGLLEDAGSKAVAVAKPTIAAVAASDAGSSAAAVMPRDLPLEPVVTGRPSTAAASIASAPAAPLIAIAGPHQVLLYHAESRDLLGVLPFEGGFPQVVRFSRDGRLLIVAGGKAAASGHAAIYDVASGDLLMTLGEEYDAVLAADLSADRSRLAIGGPSKTVKLFDPATGNLVQTISRKHTDWVLDLAFSPDGVLLASGDRAGNLFIWESFSGQPFHQLDGHKGAVTSVAWRRDSNLLASASEDGSVMLWDIQSGKSVRTIRVGQGVLSVDFAPDGRLVTASRDRKVQVWDAGGKVTQTIELTDVAVAARFDHTGKQVIAGDWAGVLRAYVADTGKPMGDLTQQPPRIADRLAAAVEYAASTKAVYEKTSTIRQAAELASKAAADNLALHRKQAGERQTELQALQTKAGEAETARAAAATQVEATSAAAKQAAGDLATTAAAMKTSQAAIDTLAATLPELETKRDAARAAHEAAIAAVEQAKEAAATVKAAADHGAESDEASETAGDAGNEAGAEAENEADAGADAGDNMGAGSDADAAVADSTDAADREVAVAAADAVVKAAEQAAAETSVALAAAEHTVTDHVARQAAAATELANLSAKHIEQSKQLAARQAARDDATNRVATLTQQRDAMTPAVDAKAAAVKEAIAAATGLEPGAAAAKAKFDEAAKQADAAKAAYDAAQASVHRWQAAEVNISRRAAGVTLRQADAQREAIKLAHEQSSAAAAQARTSLTTLTERQAALPGVMKVAAATIATRKQAADEAAAALSAASSRVAARDELVTRFAETLQAVKDAGADDTGEPLATAGQLGDDTLAKLTESHALVRSQEQQASGEFKSASEAVKAATAALRELEAESTALPARIESAAKALSEAEAAATAAAMSHQAATVAADAARAQFESLDASYRQEMKDAGLVD